MRLVAAFPTGNYDKIRHLFQHQKDIPWLYLGKDFFNIRRIELALGGEFNRIEIARLLDEIADDIRLEHVQWIDRLNREHGSELEWWFGSISSRNVYDSNLFQYSCYLEILERLWSRGQRPALIFIESPGLAKAIQKWASAKQVAVNFVNPYPARLKFLDYFLLPFLRWGKFAAIQLLRWCAAGYSGRKHKEKGAGSSRSIIINTFLHDRCVTNDGAFTDRYFPYLHEYLSGKGMQVIVHPVLHGFRFNYFSIYRRMRRSSTQFIIQEDFLRPYDYCLALSYPLRALRREIKTPPFRNFDLSGIVEEEKRRRTVASGLQAILVYRLFLRLGETGLKPGSVLTWYENQIIDKAFIAGVHEAFPDAKITGAQIFLHSPNFLSLSPSQSEVDARLTPDLLIETSDYQCEIAKLFTRDIPCRPGSALRYAHIYKNENMAARDIDEKEKTVLVLLPFDLTESVELLEMLKGWGGQIRDDVKISVKGHPDYSYNELLQAFGEKHWPHRFEIFQGGITEALEQASLIISSGSSTIVEAAAKGVPVIFAGRQTVINQNILSNLKMEIVTECFSVKELVRATHRYLNLSSEEIMQYRKMGDRIRDIFFTPVNEEAMLPFLGPEGGIHAS